MMPTQSTQFSRETLPYKQPDLQSQNAPHLIRGNKRALLCLTQPQVDGVWRAYKFVSKCRIPEVVFVFLTRYVTMLIMSEWGLVGFCDPNAMRIPVIVRYSGFPFSAISRTAASAGNARLPPSGWGATHPWPNYSPVLQAHPFSVREIDWNVAHTRPPQIRALDSSWVKTLERVLQLNCRLFIFYAANVFNDAVEIFVNVVRLFFLITDTYWRWARDGFQFKIQNTSFECDFK